MSGRRIGDIREESCRVYEGHFFPYLDYSATGLAFVLQLFSVFVFPFLLLHTCRRAHVYASPLVLCVCVPVRACIRFSPCVSAVNSHQFINTSVYCREHMAAYTIPTGLVLVEEMPRNQMGKVNKKDLLRDISSTDRVTLMCTTTNRFLVTSWVLSSGSYRFK